MRRVIILMLLFSYTLTLFSACSNKSNVQSEVTQQIPPLSASESVAVQSNLPITQDNDVSEEDMDFILSRNVFMPEMDSLYRSYDTNYDIYFNTNLTFGELINDTYFIKDLSKWEYLSHDDDSIIVTFGGIAKSVSGEVPIVVSFAWTSKMNAPIVGRFIIGTDTNEWSIDIIQDKYGYDFETATILCDAMFSCMLATALIDIADNDIQEHTTSSNSSDNPNPQSSNEQTTSSATSTEPTVPSLTAEDYYQMGKDSHFAKRYLEAADYFIKAFGYADSKTMLFDCYYEYGKIQMNLQNTAEAINYLAMCRGYKDTDEILLSFFYSEALVAYSTLIESVKTYDDIDDIYQDAEQKLLLCEGYKDSDSLFLVAETIYNARKEMDFISNWNASLYGMTADVVGNNVCITKNDFMGGGGGDLILNTVVSQKSFTASISNIFATNMLNYGEAIVIKSLLELFTDINNIEYIFDSLQDESNWIIENGCQTFSTFYEGYAVIIEVTDADWGYIDCTIIASR